MLAAYLSPLYAAVHIVLFIVYCLWLRSFGRFSGRRAFLAAVGVIWFFFGASMAIGFFLPSGSLRNFFNMIGYCHLGVFMYLCVSTIIAFIICAVKARARHERIFPIFGTAFSKAVFACALIFTAVISVYGLFHAGNVKLKEYSVSINKDAGELGSLKVILLSDTHLGYNVGAGQMRKVAELVNAQDADVILIAGDIFNNEYSAISRPDEVASVLASMQSRYGTYASWGNHDAEERILAGFNFPSDDPKEPSDEMYDFLVRSGITLLEDEGVTIADSIYIFGRKDGELTLENGESRLSPAEFMQTVDASAPVIVLDHEPDDLNGLADAGVDLTVSGHTHNGQIFPGNILMKFLWENPYGLEEFGSMTNIVSSGCGYWGPAMRIGTDSEVCVITLDFNS